jgi:hypothetical protein
MYNLSFRYSLHMYIPRHLRTYSQNVSMNLLIEAQQINDHNSHITYIPKFAVDFPVSRGLTST